MLHYEIRGLLSAACRNIFLFGKRISPKNFMS